jgi:nitroreductase
MGVYDVIGARRSVRRFLGDPIDQSTLAEILEIGTRAPSGLNIQPWHIHVVAGSVRDAISNAVVDAAMLGRGQPDYEYVTEPLPEPYVTRRRELAFELYGLRGIDRRDYAARRAAMIENYRFFGAPVGLFFTIERDMRAGAWLDVGLLMQTIMLAATARGLATCPQQSWCEYGALVRQTLGIGNDRILVSGMALGREDSLAPENQLRSSRESIDQIVTWLGF